MEAAGDLRARYGLVWLLDLSAGIAGRCACCDGMKDNGDEQG